MKTLGKIIAVMLVVAVTFIGQVSAASAFECLLTFNNDCPFEFDRPLVNFVTDFENLEPSLCYVGISLSACNPSSVAVRGLDSSAVQYLCDERTREVVFFAQNQGCAVGVSMN